MHVAVVLVKQRVNQANQQDTLRFDCTECET